MLKSWRTLEFKEVILRIGPFLKLIEAKKKLAVDSKWHSLPNGPILSITPGTLKFSMKRWKRHVET